VHEALTELTHALQLARPLARAMRMDLTEQARTAVQVEAAIDRAVAALMQARENGGHA
jgi:urease beta subunit